MKFPILSKTQKKRLHQKKSCLFEWIRLWQSMLWLDGTELLRSSWWVNITAMESTSGLLDAFLQNYLTWLRTMCLTIGTDSHFFQERRATHCLQVLLTARQKRNKRSWRMTNLAKSFTFWDPLMRALICQAFWTSNKSKMCRSSLSKKELIWTNYSPEQIMEELKFSRRCLDWTLMSVLQQSKLSMIRTLTTSGSQNRKTVRMKLHSSLNLTRQ